MSPNRLCPAACGSASLSRSTGPDVAREIARQGQALALEHSLQSGRRLTIQAIADATIAEAAGEASAARRELD